MSLYKGGAASKAFSAAFEVVCDFTDTLSNLIRRELFRAYESMKHTNSNIKSTRTKNDLDVLQLPILSVSVFLQANNGENLHELHFILEIVVKTCCGRNGIEINLNLVLRYCKLCFVVFGKYIIYML